MTLLPKNRRTKIIVVALYIAAAILIGRASVEQNRPPFPLEKYASGEVVMPYQGRCLMVPILRWAGQSSVLAEVATDFKNSVRGPQQLVLQAVNSFCLILCGWLIIRVREHFTPKPLFIWLAPFLLLWVVAITYVVRYDQRLFLPYDFISLLLFNIGLVACLERRAGLLLLVIAVGTFNRETTLFLVPIWLICNWGKSQTMVITGAVGLAEWVLVKGCISHLYHGASAGLQFNWNWNMAALVFPHHWAQLLSVGGYLVIPMWMNRNLIEDQRLKVLWFGCVPFLIGALIFGVWNETRIFGELSILIATTASVQFEQFVQKMDGLCREAS